MRGDTVYSKKCNWMKKLHQITKFRLYPDVDLIYWVYDCETYHAIWMEVTTVWLRMAAIKTAPEGWSLVHIIGYVVPEKILIVIVERIKAFAHCHYSHWQFLWKPSEIVSTLEIWKQKKNTKERCYQSFFPIPVVSILHSCYFLFEVLDKV